MIKYNQKHTGTICQWQQHQQKVQKARLAGLT
jgi:hypothetical protein